MPERELQRSIRKTIADCGFYSVHVPNGAHLAGDPERAARQMNALKRDGLMPGFPDLIVYGRAARIGHMEVKTAKGKLQDTQIAVQAWLEAMGHHFALVRSVDDTLAALRLWGWL